MKQVCQLVKVGGAISLEHSHKALPFVLLGITIREEAVSVGRLSGIFKETLPNEAGAEILGQLAANFRGHAFA